MKRIFQSTGDIAPVRLLLALCMIGVAGAWPPTCAAAQVAWTPRVSVEEHSVATGLPVLLLNRDGWPQLVRGPSVTARAAQRASVVLGVENPSGWRMGALVRSQAAVAISPGAMALAQAVAGDALPVADTQFGLGASYLGWRGRGFTVGLPWQPLAGDDWRWTVDAQWLQLADLRHTQLQGTARYQAASQEYGFDVTADQANRGITGPFLGSSGPKGVGYSVSLAVEGRISPSLSVSIKADDLLSRLRWGQLAREQLTLHSVVERRRPDGFLDYAPAISGKQGIQPLLGRMGARYDTQLAWQYASAAALSARWHRLDGMDELWLGWSTRWPERSMGLQLGFEVARQAVAAKLTWYGFYLDVGSDGKGMTSEYRKLGMGWDVRF